MKYLILYIAVMLAFVVCGTALAAKSPENGDLQHTDVKDVTPDRPSETPVEPTVEITPDTDAVDHLREEMKTIFRLTIKYVYADGSTAAPTYSAFLSAGDAYDIVSPVIDGYTASMKRVTGVMPHMDIDYTVIYIGANDQTFLRIYDLSEYETPLGLGFYVKQVGYCVE